MSSFKIEGKNFTDILEKVKRMEKEEGKFCRHRRENGKTRLLDIGEGKFQCQKCKRMIYLNKLPENKNQAQSAIDDVLNIIEFLKGFDEGIDGKKVIGQLSELQETIEGVGERFWKILKNLNGGNGKKKHSGIKFQEISRRINYDADLGVGGGKNNKHNNPFITR